MEINTAILVALISAVISFIVQLYFKKMEYSHSAKTIEKAILAEISAIILVIEKRKFCEVFEEIIKAYNDTPSRKYELTIKIQNDIFPVYSNNIDKIGSVDSKKISQIVMFYSLLNSVIQNVIPGGVLNDPSIIDKSEHFTESYSILIQAFSMGKQLVNA